MPTSSLRRCANLDGSSTGRGHRLGVFRRDEHGELFDHRWTSATRDHNDPRGRLRVHDSVARGAAVLLLDRHVRLHLALDASRVQVFIDIELIV